MEMATENTDEKRVAVPNSISVGATHASPLRSRVPMTREPLAQRGLLTNP